MKFQAGTSGNPRGRPKGAYGGRIAALMTLDRMMAKKRTQAALLREMEKTFDKDPMGFFRTIIMPLLPKESKLAIDAEGVVQWRSLIGAGGKDEGGNLKPEAGSPTDRTASDGSAG